MSSAQSENEKLRQFFQNKISVISKLVGTAAGVTITKATGMPYLGALLAPFAAESLSRVGNELIQKHLAPRQEIRASRAYLIAYQQIIERTNNGEQLRSDGFFEEAIDGGRPPADEVTETALHVAMNSTQEDKVDFIALLLTNIAFNSKIDGATANFLMATAETMSFQAFAIIKAFSSKNKLKLPVRPGGIDIAIPLNLSPLLAEIYSLITRGLLIMKDEATDVSAYAVLGLDDIDPSRIHLTNLGELVLGMLELDRIADSNPTYLQLQKNLEAITLLATSKTKIDGGPY